MGEREEENGYETSCGMPAAMLVSFCCHRCLVQSVSWHTSLSQHFGYLREAFLVVRTAGPSARPVSVSPRILRRLHTKSCGAPMINSTILDFLSCYCTVYEVRAKVETLENG